MYRGNVVEGRDSEGWMFGYVVDGDRSAVVECGRGPPSLCSAIVSSQYLAGKYMTE